MFHVILVCPEIPPNTGNAIRLCANTGAQLHLVRPLGFELDDARMRRAGLDYHEWQPVRVHDTLQEALDDTGADASSIYALTTQALRCACVVSAAWRISVSNRVTCLCSAAKRQGCRPSIKRCSRPSSACGCRCAPASAA